MRQKLNMSAAQGLFLMAANGKYMLKQSDVLADVQDKHQDADGFLYLFYVEENIYG